MCGLTGIFSRQELTHQDISQLRTATDCLRKRGPDAQQTWHDDRVGLGHSRLSIIDTSEKGLQPMPDASGRYKIVYNGEVYNYRSIRKDLEAKGYRFNSETDTEVVLNAFVEWGSAALDRFNGFFAFAVYDLEHRSLFLARDKIGIKPLYYSETDQFFAFASEPKGLIPYGISKEIDVISLNLYFQLTYIPGDRSIFRDVRKLLPGQFLRYYQGTLRTETYYHLPYRQTPSVSDLDQAKIAIRDTLREAVTQRLVSDVPLGSFLSGGIDSSIITSIAAKEVDHFHTFSIGFEDGTYDESKFAELAARHFGTVHHTYRLTHDDLLDQVEDVVSYLDEPFADSSAIPVYILSKLTRGKVTVALSGDGADEIFSGYNKHAAWMLSTRKDLLNRVLAVGRPFFAKLPQSRGGGLSNLFRQLNRYSQIIAKPAAERYWMLASFGTAPFRKRILNENHFLDLTPISSEMMSGFDSDDLNMVLFKDAGLVLPGDMLTKVDRMSMANSLEVRVPFLDQKVVDLAFDLPSRLKVKGNTRKYILREAFREDLPPELYTRRKHGFDVPLLHWFRAGMREKLERTVFDKDLIIDQGIFRPEGLWELRNRLDSTSPGDVAIHLWQIYVFQKWYKNVISDLA